MMAPASCGNRIFASAFFLKRNFKFEWLRLTTAAELVHPIDALHRKLTTNLDEEENGVKNKNK